jgi:hypothetical protein
MRTQYVKRPYAKIPYGNRPGAQYTTGFAEWCAERGIIIHVGSQPTEVEDPNTFEAGWYFWTEDWVGRLGPYATSRDAVEAFLLYRQFKNISIGIKASMIEQPEVRS